MNSVAEQKMTLTWEKYPSFFALWRAHRRSTQLVYVIGSEIFCYVGSIGARSGQQGLGMRYQWQYLVRAKAIFGLDESRGQVSFAATFDETVDAQDVLAAEAHVQNCFITIVGPEHALFEAEKLVDNYSFVHLGDAPRFLKETFVKNP